MVVKKKTVSKSAATKKKVAVKKTVTTKKVAAKKPVAKAVAKPAAKSAAKKTVAKKVAVKKPVAKKKAVVKKPEAVKKTVAKKVVAKKAIPVKKPVAVAIPAAKAKAVKAVKPTVEIVKAPPVAIKAKVVAQAKPKPVVKQHKPSPIDNIPLIEAYNEQEGDDYMDVTQRQRFRELLNNWKYELMQEVDRTVGYMKDEAANFPDPADRATQEEEFNLELRTRDRERKLIKKIDEALQRIDENDYGFCEACGVEIGTKRLEARPTATLCIDCKTVDEIREKQLLA